ncbi:MAG: hypothetical protein M1830_006216, partial [Pleopsidium flavum]
MSFLQDATLLPNTLQHGKSIKEKNLAVHIQPHRQQLRSKGSIASLVSIVRNPVATVGDAFEGFRDGLTKEERVEKRRVEDKKQILYLRLRNSTNYDEWKAHAEALDDIEGNDAWKSIVDSPDYDVGLVAARLEQLDDARTSCDVGRMLFLI